MNKPAEASQNRNLMADSAVSKLLLHSYLVRYVSQLIPFPSLAGDDLPGRLRQRVRGAVLVRDGQADAWGWPGPAGS